MSFRFVRRWHIEHRPANSIGGKGTSVMTFKTILQADGPDGWKDIPVVDDEESRIKATEDLKKIKAGVSGL